MISWKPCFRPVLINAVTRHRNGFPANARATLALNGFPIYVHLPRGAKITLTGEKLGTNYASVAQGATASASSEQSPSRRLRHRRPLHGPRRRARYPVTHLLGRGRRRRDRGKTRVATDHPAAAAPVGSRPAAHYPARRRRRTPRDYALQMSTTAQSGTLLPTSKIGSARPILLAFAPVKTHYARLLVTRLNDGWHLDGRWMFMVSADFKRYTSLHCRVLEC